MHHLEAADYVLFGGITNWGLCGQGDSLADSSEERLQGEKGGARIHGRLCWEKNVLKDQKITATQKKKKTRHLKLVILVLSMYKKMQESGVIEMTPSMCVLTI